MGRQKKKIKNRREKRKERKKREFQTVSGLESYVMLQMMVIVFESVQ